MYTYVLYYIFIYFYLIIALNMLFATKCTLSVKPLDDSIL